MVHASVYLILILFNIGLLRESWSNWVALFNPKPPASPFLQDVAVTSEDPDPENDASTTKIQDCRNDILTRGDNLQIESWQAVDQRFNSLHPNVETIDPLNPEHRVYIQTWCYLANEWMEQG